jgi:hypothetical protein
LAKAAQRLHQQPQQRPNAVADRATGPGPDVAAFHCAGIAAVRISDGVLTVRLRPEATDARRAKIRAVLAGSALTASAEEQHGD